jgi:hypothetical protein
LRVMAEGRTGSNGQKQEEKVVTSAEFITASPMFVNVRVNGFSPPQKISLECHGPCNKETTWELFYDPVVVGGKDQGSALVPDWSLKSVAYKCLLCGESKLTVIYREMLHAQREIGARVGTGLSRNATSPPSSIRIVVGVMKVGQYPALTVSIPKGLEKALGSDASGLYRKALISRNAGFGLAAVGYMRRVVEDKTNELIEVAAQYADSNGAEPETVAAIRAAVNPNEYTPYEQKLKLAATVFPANLKVGDVNPLQILFRDVSKGLHGLSEEECIEIADEIRTVFEYVFENLKAQVSDRRAFMEKIKKLL